MKRSAIVLLVLMLVLSLSLAACASAPAESEEAAEPVAAQEEEQEQEQEEEVEEAPVAELYTWETKQGEFVLSERIAKKVAAGEELIIRVSTWDPTSPFFADVRVGIEQAAADLGADIKLIGPAESSAEKQVSELETLIKGEQIDGLAISCGDADTMKPIFDLAWEKGIPVVTFDCDSPESPRLAYIGTDHYIIGQKSAEQIMAYYPEKEGKIAFFAAFPEGVYARERIKGIQDTLADNGYELEEVGPFKLGIDMAEGYAVVENTFLGNPDIDVVYTTDEFVEVPAEYVNRNDLGDQVTIIGINTLPGVLKYVELGIIDATIGVAPNMQGYIAAETLFNFISEGTTTDEFIYVDLPVVTMDNVADFMN